jgi:hypothetical protein
MGGGQSDKNSVGGLLTSTVSVLLLRTMGTSGISHRFAFLSNHPLNMAAHDTVNVVFCALYMFTSLLSKTVMYSAAKNLVVLRRELDSTDGTMWMSFAGWRTSCASFLLVAAAFCVLLGSWKILSDVPPIGMKGAVVVLTLEVVALSVTMDGMEPSRTLCLMSCLRVYISFTLLMHLVGLLFSCSLTWQGGGAVSENIA